MIQKLKKEGMKSGIPDLFILEWNLAIEMKRQKGGTVSSEQKDWIQYFEEKCQLKVIVAKGCQDAVNQVMHHLGMSIA